MFLLFLFFLFLFLFFFSSYFPSSSSPFTVESRERQRDREGERAWEKDLPTGERELRISSSFVGRPKIEREREREREKRNLREIGREIEMCNWRNGLGSFYSEMDGQDCSKTIASNGWGEDLGRFGAWICFLQKVDRSTFMSIDLLESRSIYYT